MTWAKDIAAGVGLILILAVAYIATGYIDRPLAPCNLRVCAWENK